MLPRASFIVFVCLLAAGTAHAGETWRQQEQRAAEQRQLTVRYSEVSQKLNAAANKSSLVKEESRQEYKRLSEELKRKQELANRKMSQFQSATPENWDRLKVETNAAIEDLNATSAKMKALMK